MTGQPARASVATATDLARGTLMNVRTHHDRASCGPRARARGRTRVLLITGLLAACGDTDTGRLGGAYLTPDGWSATPPDAGQTSGEADQGSDAPSDDSSLDGSGLDSSGELDGADDLAGDLDGSDEGTVPEPAGARPDASKLPTVSGPCELHDGAVTVAGSKVQLWVGTKPGPVYFYFHGTGTSPAEVDSALPGATAAVKANGGMVASWETSNQQDDSTGSFWAVWYTGDFKAADQLLACGIEAGIVDTSRIHAAGYSAGGLQTGAMAFMRSNYLASVVVYSGGKGFGAGSLSDPSHVPAMLGAHGKKGMDSLILDFSDTTQSLETELKSAGGLAVDCDDGQAHYHPARLGVEGNAMQFLAAHPYGVKANPYAGGLPAGWPSYCRVVP